MGETSSSLDAKTIGFIRAQRVFFVATAPLAADGHVNLSPKGLDSLAVLDDRTVGYLDLHGSGIETVAHLRENGRVVLMFCAFDGPPRIVRLHGRGEAIEPTDARFAPALTKFPPLDGVRAFVRIVVTRVSSSCGYGVPLMKFESERTQLPAWSTKLGPSGLAEYRSRKNRRSLDGLPGVDS